MVLSNTFRENILRNLEIFIFALILSLVSFFGISSSVSAEDSTVVESNPEVATYSVPGDPGGMPVYPGTNVTAKPGDVLLSSKNTTRYFSGHVAIVDNGGYVIHAPGIGKGLERITIYQYAKDYDNVQVYSAKSSTNGTKAASQANYLFNNYKNATYTVATSLTGPKDKQYCTKLVWQAYYYGSSINLGGISLTKTTVPPSWIIDTDYLVFKVSGV